MRRRRFHNPEPLTQKDMEPLEKLRLEAFPLINDFFIELRPAHQKFGNHLYYVSNAQGDLISFPWWDHVDRDLQQWTQKDIPIGVKGQPYYDMEQGWQLIVFRRGDYVYLLQGGGSEDRRAVFHTWFCVARKAYLAEWEKLLMHHNPNYTLSEQGERHD